MAYAGCGVLLLAVFIAVTFEPALRGQAIVVLLSMGGTMVLGPASGFFDLKRLPWRAGGAVALFVIIFSAAAQVLGIHGN